MKRKIFVFTILGVCATMSAWANYPIGTFVAPKGADGTAGCSPRIYQTNKTGGCYQIKSQAQKRVSGVCTDDTSINAVTLDNICDGCTPTYSKKYIHGSVSSPTYNDTSANAIGTRVTVSGCGEDPVNIDTYDGDDGTSFNFKGKKDTCDELYAITGAQQNDAWLVAEDGLLYIYNGTNFPSCPNGGAAFTGPAGDSNCTGLETSNTAVKNTTLTYSGPTKSDSGLSYYTTKGKMTTSHTPCNPNATIDDSVQDDSCTLIAAPSGSTCTGSKKTYYECKTQAADGSLAKGATYNLCVSTAGDSISNALDGKEDTACVGDNSNSASVERKKTVSYTAPTGSEGYGTYSWKTAVGKVVNKSIKCDNSETTISSTPDKCEEIAKPNGVCTASGKVYYKCTQQNDGTEYNLCADGNSVLGAAQSAAETAVAAVDPCASVANGTDNQKKAQIKSMNSTYTLQTVSSGNDRTAVGYSTLTKTTCATGADATQVEYQYDTCKEIADTRTSGACSGNDKVYLECVNQTKGAGDSGYTYKVCQTVTANTSLSGKITAAQTTATNAASVAAQAQTTANGKIDANYLSNNGYLTSSSSLPAANLTGTIDSGRLPSTVVTVGDDATHGLNTLLATKKYVTESGLESAVSSAVSEKTVTFGNLQVTLDEALELVGKAAGTCTRTPSGGDSENAVSCSNGALGSVSTTGKNTGN